MVRCFCDESVVRLGKRGNQVCLIITYNVHYHLVLYPVWKSNVLGFFAREAEHGGN